MAEEATRRFNPNDHLTQIKTREGARDYLGVQWRLVWFREQYPHGSIETEMTHLDPDRETEEDTFAWNSETRRSERVTKRVNGFCVFRAIVKDGEGGVATGTKSEKAASFPDYIEKAETGAIGRALAALGFGTQFAPELNEEHRIVDAPVEQQGQATTTNKPATSAPRQAPQQAKQEPKMSGSMADEKQMQSIQALCKSLGRGIPTRLFKDAADKMQADLEKEYQARQPKSA